MGLEPDPAAGHLLTGCRVADPGRMPAGWRAPGEGRPLPAATCRCPRRRRGLPGRAGSPLGGLTQCPRRRGMQWGRLQLLVLRGWARWPLVTPAQVRPAEGRIPTAARTPSSYFQRLLWCLRWKARRRQFLRAEAERPAGRRQGPSAREGRPPTRQRAPQFVSMFPQIRVMPPFPNTTAVTVVYVLHYSPMRHSGTTGYGVHTVLLILC